jgi:hypothetical protein
MCPLPHPTPLQVLSDPEVRKYVGGVAMQWAGKYAVLL